MVTKKLNTRILGQGSVNSGNPSQGDVRYDNQGFYNDNRASLWGRDVAYNSENLRSRNVSSGNDKLPGKQLNGRRLGGKKLPVDIVVDDVIGDRLRLKNNEMEDLDEDRVKRIIEEVNASDAYREAQLKNRYFGSSQGRQGESQYSRRSGYMDFQGNDYSDDEFIPNT